MIFCSHFITAVVENYASWVCGHEVKGHVHDHRGYAVYAAQVRSGEDEASGGECGIDPINTVIIH